MMRIDSVRVIRLLAVHAQMHIKIQTSGYQTVMTFRAQLSIRRVCDETFVDDATLELHSPGGVDEKLFGEEFLGNGVSAVEMAVRDKMYSAH